MPAPEGSSVAFRRVPASMRRAPIIRFARSLQKDVSKGCAFDVLIAGDTELRRLNREFRGQDYPTDVLSFPASAFPLDARNLTCNTAPGPSRSPVGGARPAHLGDIAISLARARTQAREFGHTIEQEVQILMLHGVLHLMGHDHETDSGAMARAEKRWRAKLGLPTSLIERVRA
jgi:probable rRNA maturation factor